MRMAISTTLDTSAERARDEARTSRLFEHVAKPVLTVEPLDPPTLPAE
ncbi:hypothetical protein [uncultured Sphingomonas sp.]